MQTYNSFNELAEATCPSPMSVFNKQPPAPPRRNLVGQKIKDAASAANAWMGHNIGVAVPSGKDLGTMYGDAVATVGQDFAAGRKAMAKDFPVNPDTDSYTAAQNTIAQGLGGVAGVIGFPLGRYVERTIEGVFPKTSDDKQNTNDDEQE